MGAHCRLRPDRGTSDKAWHDRRSDLFGKPLTIIPMVVTEVQDYIAAGQIKPTDLLIDAQQASRPGTLTVFLEPLYEGGFASIPPGSLCIANAYTNNHDLLADKNIGTGRWLFLHVVDAVALVHALIIRLQALLFRCRPSCSRALKTLKYLKQ